MRNIWLYVICIILMWSCNGSHIQEKEKLDEINSICESQPLLALSMLDSLDKKDMPEKVRHFHDFLTIKANNHTDKTPDSDSLILDVIKYYSIDDKKNIFPEVLLQAGTIYYKLGDKPTALRYLQESLDLLPAETERKKLRSNVVGTIGELLYSIRLYGEASPYLTESVEMATTMKDSLTLMNHTYLLGMVKTEAGKLKEAEKHFNLSRNIAEKISPQDTLRCDINLTSIKSTYVKADSAVSRKNRGTKSSDNPDHNKALANAAGIVFRSDLMNIVFQHAKDSSLKITPEMMDIAFDLLNHDSSQCASQDSLYSFIKKYSGI
ncbi:MAG: hypothetical protein K2H22_06955, partial [Muribaculaceae bacterium]|nr:hypothetical protein [Muribaculaceae bacterium]